VNRCRPTVPLSINCSCCRTSHGVLHDNILRSFDSCAVALSRDLLELIFVRNYRPTVRVFFDATGDRCLVYFLYDVIINTVTVCVGLYTQSTALIFFAVDYVGKRCVCGIYVIHYYISPN